MYDFLFIAHVNYDEKTYSDFQVCKTEEIYCYSAMNTFNSTFEKIVYHFIAKDIAEFYYGNDFDMLSGNNFCTYFLRKKGTNEGYLISGMSRRNFINSEEESILTAHSIFSHSFSFQY